MRHIRAVRGLPFRNAYSVRRVSLRECGKITRKREADVEQTTRTYLVDHDEEGVVLAIVTNKLFNDGSYLGVLEGEAPEEDIHDALRDYPLLQQRNVIYLFDE